MVEMTGHPAGLKAAQLFHGTRDGNAREQGFVAGETRAGQHLQRVAEYRARAGRRVQDKAGALSKGRELVLGW